MHRAPSAAIARAGYAVIAGNRAESPQARALGTEHNKAAATCAIEKPLRQAAS
ncbi:hypothetical protein X947_4164 [Burkholderia pseudomallei MSHR7334]|nr:hypothetical protein X947_4164 [Burkholderia pseudomallei MSHR7334]